MNQHKWKATSSPTCSDPRRISWENSLILKSLKKSKKTDSIETHATVSWGMLAFQAE